MNPAGLSDPAGFNDGLLVNLDVAAAENLIDTVRIVDGMLNACEILPPNAQAEGVRAGISGPDLEYETAIRRGHAFDRALTFDLRGRAADHQPLN